MKRFLRVSFAIGLVLGIALASFAIGVPVLTGRAGLGQRSATEMVHRFSPGCADGCLGLVEWFTLVDEPAAVRALFLAYEHAPQWRPLARQAVRYRTTVSAASLDEGIGFFQHGSNRIVIDTDMLDEPLDVLAALLAHEVAHAATVGPWPWSARPGCLDRELEAVRWELYVYGRTPGFEGPSRYADDLRRRQEARDAGELRDFLADVYADKCGKED